MPSALPRICGTCGQIGCSTHTREAWRSQNRPAPDRVRGTTLQKLRKSLFDRQPLCVRCKEQGRVSRSVIRDHIVPLAEGGQDVESNVQALCRDCSDLKTQEEAKRGMKRART